MTSLIKIIVFSLMSLLLFSCNFDGFFNQLDGKGEVTTQQYELEEPFNQIVVENGWDVVLIRSESPKLVVQANKNLHPELKFSINNQQLHIRSKKNIGFADAKTIQVYFSGELQKITANSGSDIVSNEIFEQEKIRIEASSGADIELSVKTNFTEVESSSGADIELTGTTNNLQTDASSGADIDAENFRSKNANAEASSGAEISLSVSETFSAEASSGGQVDYYGNPKKVTVDNSISGDVHKH